MNTMPLTVACVQLTTINDMTHNIAQIEHWIREAAGRGAHFIATPENSFYMRASDKDDVPLFAMSDHAGTIRCQALAKELGVWILIGSVFVPSCLKKPQENRWFNRSVLINADGHIVTYYDKIHLFDASFGENKHYKESARICPGNQVTVADTPWGKLGMTICYDVRFPHLYRDLAKHGVDLIAVPAAFARVTGEAHWHILLRARAIENGAFVIAPAQCGVHPGDKHTFGHAMIVNPWGEIVVEAGDDPCVIIAEIDMGMVQRVRRNLPTLQHDRAYFPPPDYAI
jgi:deaminated glutathione amidase